MRELPLRARLFLFGCYAAGIFCLLEAFSSLSAPLIVQWIAATRTAPLAHAQAAGELLVFVVLAAAAGHWKVKVMRFHKAAHDETGEMSFGFALIFAALLYFGAQGAVIVGISSTVYSCLRPRLPWFQFLFNVSVNIAATVLASKVFSALNGGVFSGEVLHALPAIIAASLTFFFVNTGVVATIMALCSNQRPTKVWSESFLWTAPSYFIGAAASTIANKVMGNHLIGTILCLAPVAYLTYTSYRSYMKHTEDLLKSKEDLLKSKEDLATVYQATIRSLALAIDAKDQYTHQHILRVQKYAVATAKGMGISGDELQAIETGALLHDIGKLGVPEYVLLKPGRLTDEEFAKIKEHPRIGADILDPVTFPWPVLPLVKHHHEKLDGTGYPDGLKGDEIPRTARILAVADVYDALTSSRSYRSAWNHERAVAEVRAKAGTHFDPVVVDAFCRIIDGVLEEMGRTKEAAQIPGGEKTLETVTTHRSAEAVRHIQQTSSELWALYEVAQTLSASLGLDDTLQILARKLRAIFPDTGCVFMLRSSMEFEQGAGNELTARAAVGTNEDFFSGCRTLSAESLSLRVAQSRTSYVGPYEHDDLLPNSSNTTAWISIGTALIVPVVHQGEVLGTINLYHTGTEAFGPHDQYLLEMIGRRAALALFNGLLFDRTRSHAITDSLTGLANARHITECVDNSIARSKENGKTFALLCLDLDSFKPINDNFGHQIGDRVLRELGHLFQAQVKEKDIVARYGGDEFLVLLDDAGDERAERIAQRIQEAVASYDPHLHHDRLGDLRIGVSVGTACFPKDGEDCGTLLSVADAVMYGNKTERKLKFLVDKSGETVPPPPVFALGSGNGQGETKDKEAANPLLRAA